ncbi:MAG TPA: hypothetical protein VHW09_31850 [Bryobacteraceae bacterium]|jgi:hypothetical protein|nr:hypothetical protein [Bryobacteraceae bacterium]
MLLDTAKNLARKVQTLFTGKPEDEDDPDLMAFVGAPLKPRTPLKSSSVAVQPEP